MAVTTHIKAVKGDTLGPVRLVFKNADKTPFDLTGSTLIMRIHAEGGTIELSSAVDGDGFEIDQDEVGVANLSLTAEQTARLFIGVNSSFRLRREIGQEKKTIASGFFDVAKGGP